MDDINAKHPPPHTGPRARKLTPNTMLVRGVLHRKRPLCGPDGKVIMRLGQPQWEWVPA